MRYTPGDGSNIEDRRGGGGGGGGFRIGGGAAPVGVGGLLLLLVLSWATGTNFLQLLDTGGGDTAVSDGPSPPANQSPAEQRMVGFVDAVAGDVQDTWEQLLGNRYQRVKTVLFRDATQTGCGQGAAATGPFYCPGDQRVYLDLSFFDELAQRFGAPGDFAQAYVIVHEYGHHVQSLLGYSERVGNDRRGANSGSVALELQADCFAGVWGMPPRRADASSQARSSWIREMRKRRCGRRRRLATIACRRWPAAASNQNASRTARPPSAWNGSSAVSRPASHGSATRSPRVHTDRPRRDTRYET